MEVLTQIGIALLTTLVFVVLTAMYWGAGVVLSILISKVAW